LPRSKSRDRARDGATGARAAHQSDSPPRRKIPWVPIAITFAVLLTAAFAVDPIRDAATLGPVGEASLRVPAAYLVMAPLSNSLDTLTLLTVGQHIAIILWAMGIFAAVRVMRARRGGTSIRREAIAAVLLLAGIFVTYATATMVPRPMAQLSARISRC
jgi:hypothetical protein